MSTPRMDHLSEPERRTVNQVAREQMKLKLLADIQADLMICDIEGWDKREYIKDLQDTLNRFTI